MFRDGYGVIFAGRKNLETMSWCFLPERISNGDESIQMNSGQIPDDDWLEDREDESLDGADQDAREEGPGEERGRREDQEDQGEADVHQRQMQEQKVAWFAQLKRRTENVGLSLIGEI